MLCIFENNKYLVMHILARLGFLINLRCIAPLNQLERREVFVRTAMKLVEYFSSRNPFDVYINLRNIYNGVVADKEVNLLDDVTVGEKIIDRMVGKDNKTFVLKKDETVKSQGKKRSSVAVGMMFLLTESCSYRELHHFWIQN